MASACHAAWIALALFRSYGEDRGHAKCVHERGALLAGDAPRRPALKYELVLRCPWLAALIALVLVVLGVLPQLESALYFAAVVLFLLIDPLIMLFMVLGSWRPQTA